MCCETANNHGTARTTVRLAAALVCAFFVASLLLSSVFIALHANHEHDRNGENGTCAACAHVAAAKNALKTLSAAATVSICAVIICLCTSRVLKAAHTSLPVHTLIGLKVRIDS